MSLNTPRMPPRFFGFSSEPMEVIFLLLPELLAPRHVPLPRRNLRHDVRQQPERVDRWQDRHAHQVAERHDHEDGFQLVPHLDGMPGELVPRHAVHELGGRLPQTREARREGASHSGSRDTAPGRAAAPPGGVSCDRTRQARAAAGRGWLAGCRRYFWKARQPSMPMSTAAATSSSATSTMSPDPRTGIIRPAA